MLLTRDLSWLQIRYIKTLDHVIYTFTSRTPYAVKEELIVEYHLRNCRGNVIIHQ